MTMGWGDALLKALGGAVGGVAGGLIGDPAGFAAGAGFGAGLGGLAADAMTDETQSPAMQGAMQQMIRKGYAPTALPQLPGRGGAPAAGGMPMPSMEAGGLSEDPMKAAAMRYAMRLRKGMA